MDFDSPQAELVTSHGRREWSFLKGIALNKSMTILSFNPIVNFVNPWAIRLSHHHSNPILCNTYCKTNIHIIIHKWGIYLSLFYAISHDPILRGQCWSTSHASMTDPNWEPSQLLTRTACWWPWQHWEDAVKMLALYHSHKHGETGGLPLKTWGYIGYIGYMWCKHM